MSDKQQLLKGKNSKVSVQIFRSLFVAVAALGVHYSFFTFFKWNEILASKNANYVANCFGMITNYLLSVYWVFDKRQVDNRLAEFVIFAVIGVIGVLIHAEILEFVLTFEWAQGFEMLSEISQSTLSKIDDTLAFGVATGVTFFWNFLVRKFVLFNKEGSKISS